MPPTAAGLPGFAAEHHGDRPALLAKEDGAWRARTYAEVAREVDRLAAGLVARGVAPGDRVCILADTRPEWTIAAYAVWSAGAIVVPLYPTSSPEELQWVAADCGAVAIVAEDAGQLRKVEAIRERLPALREVLVIDPDAGGGGTVALDDVAAAGAGRGEVERRRAAVSPVDPALIVYTSGTTGSPKGCVLSHRGVMSVCAMVLQVRTLRPEDVAYLYLPLAHVLAQVVQLAAFQVGAAIAYYGGDANQILAELREVRPSLLPSVPRIFENVYAVTMARIPPDQRDDIGRGVQVGLQVHALEARGAGVPAELRRANARADEPVFSKVRVVFGGRLRTALTGAGPIGVDIPKFFYASGVPVMEGYGLAETTGIGTLNLPDAFEFGTAGRPLPGVELAIAPDGEILFRGPHLFSGYWHDETATREVLDADGWLHTGDVGTVDESGFLSIAGRKRDVIVTAAGKSLTPAGIENDLRRSPFISQAVMFGDRRPFPVALVTLDREAMVPWARERGLPQDLDVLARDPQVRAVVQAALDAANARYGRGTRVERFAILDHDLSQAAGELTPMLKVRRDVVHDRYADVVDQLYTR